MTSWRNVVLFVLTALALVLCVLLAWPFLSAIVMAAAFAVVTHRPHHWLRQRVTNRTVVAALMVVLVAALLIGPVTFIAQALIKEAFTAIRYVQQGDAQQSFTDFLARYPRISSLVDRVTDTVNFRQATQQTANFVGTRLGTVVSGSVGILTQVAIMLFTLFFLYRDEEEAVGALRSLLPLTDSQADRLLTRWHDTTFATLSGSGSVALIQGCLGGLAFWFLGVPGAALWAFVMAMLALIPSLGTFLVWAPVAGYLALTGQWGKAAVLTGWGVFVIGTVDNLLYPTLVGSRMQMHTLPVFFSVLGGIGLFGLPGLVIGPVALATAISLLRIWKEKAQVIEPASHIIAESADLDHVSSRA